MRYVYFPSSSTGWTLLEVLVALVLMTTISALGYKGISTLITAESSLREESERLLALDIAFSQGDMDWNAQLATLLLPKASSPTPPKTMSTPVRNPAQWTLTPINGWIPAPSLLPRVPPALEPYLTRRYTVNYQAHPQGGIERGIGCESASSTLADSSTSPICQRWHLLSGVPVEIQGTTSSTTPHKRMQWTFRLPQGSVERLWSLPTPPPS